MLCENPYRSGIRAYPCGRCGPCLAYRRSVWSSRLQMEAGQHGDNAFVTLTYRDDTLPKFEGLATLCPVHTRNWLKRLRKSWEPNKLRFFLVGEYGSKTDRPHYHALLFGYPTCLNHQTRLDREICCPVCSAVAKTWPFGSVQVARVEPASIGYVCGYVLKKMTKKDDIRLGGRHPEFARMSRRPFGIGATAMDDVASAMMYQDLSKLEDVSELRGSCAPRGRYLRRELRKRLGREPAAVETNEQKQKVLGVLSRSIANKVSVARQVVTENEGARASLKWKLSNMGKKNEKV